MVEQVVRAAPPGLRRWRVRVELLDPEGSEQPAPMVVEAYGLRGALWRAGARPTHEWEVRS